MISSQDGHSITITEFESDEQGDGFDGIVTSIDVVSHEEVVGVGRVATDAEEFREVVLWVGREGEEGKGRAEEAQKWDSKYTFSHPAIS